MGEIYIYIYIYIYMLLGSSMFFGKSTTILSSWPYNAVYVYERCCSNEPIKLAKKCSVPKQMVPCMFWEIIAQNRRPCWIFLYSGVIGPYIVMFS
jgi:hypothetical protein